MLEFIYIHLRSYGTLGGIMNMRGFSLVEIMVGVTMLGALGVGAMKIADSQRDAFEYQQSKGRELELYNQVRYILQDKSICEESLTTNPINISNPNNLSEFNTIYNEDSEPFITANSEDATGTYRVQPFVVKPIGSAAGPGEKNIMIEVAVERLKGIKSTFRKDIFLTVRMNAAGVIEECLTEQDLVTTLGVGEMCEAVGGTYVPGPPATCDLTCPSPMAGLTTALSTACLHNFKDTVLDNRYVYDSDVEAPNGIADTMTGNLVVTGNITAPKNILATNQFCIGGNCQNFQARTCSNGRVVMGFDGSGNPVCIDPGDCGANRYFKGIDASGAAICADYTVPSPCPSGQFVNRVNANGTFSCAPATSSPSTISCPNGQYIAGITSSGSPVCRDEWNLEDFSCPANQYVHDLGSGTFVCRSHTTDRHVWGTSCSGNQVIRGYNGDGSVRCISVPACSPSQPAANTICSGVTETGNDGCGGSYSVSGTKTDGSCCTDSTWSPAPSTVCNGTSFTQTSNCGNTRTATGTSASACGPSGGNYVCFTESEGDFGGIPPRPACEGSHVFNLNGASCSNTGAGQCVNNPPGDAFQLCTCE